MKILILDGNENQAVACARSLGRAGHAVSVGESTSWSKAGWSRWCSGTFVYPAPQVDAETFVACVAREAAREPGTLVLPMTESTTLPLSARRDRLDSAGARHVLPPHETVLRAFDKVETTRLAESLGIAVPRSHQVDDLGQARDVARTFTYPAVLKPRSSEQLTASGQMRATGAPVYARDEAEFVAAFENLALRSPSVIAQEFIAGGGSGWYALMRDGELRAEFAHRRIRDVRPTGSGSALRESVYPEPRLREAGLKVLTALRWHGVAMVEFRVRPDGSPVFLEVNGRFWNSLALAVYAGADFPALLAELAERGDVAPPPRYRAGVRCRWLLGDFRHLLEVMRGAPAGWPGAWPGRLSTLANFLLPVPGTYHDNFQLGDPLPELADWIDFFFRKLPRTLKKRTQPRDLEPSAHRRAAHP